MPIIQLLARTVAALGVKAPGSAQAIIRSQIFEEVFTKVLKNSSGITGRLKKFILDGLGRFSEQKISSLSKSLGKAAKGASYVVRYILSDAFTGVQSLSDDEFIRLVRKLSDGASAVDLLDDIDFSILTEFVDDIQYLRDIVAAGVIVGVVVRLNKNPQLISEYFTEGKEIFIANSKITRKGQSLIITIGGKKISTVDLTNQPVVMGVLLLKSWTDSDILTTVKEFFTDEEIKEETVSLSPSADRLLNYDAADRMLAEARDAR